MNRLFTSISVGLILFSCSQDESTLPIIDDPDPPSATTLAPSDISYFHARVHASFDDRGSNEAYNYGIAWSEIPNVSVQEYSTVLDSGLLPTEWDAVVLPLQPATEYYYASLVIDSEDTLWGEELMFTTLEVIESKATDSIMYSEELIIKAGTICGWTLANDSLSLNAMETYYTFHDPSTNEQSQYSNSTITEQWNAILQVLDLDAFFKSTLNDCAICVDGCDMWIQIEVAKKGHRIRFDHYRALESNNYGGVNFQKLKPFVQMLDSLRLVYKDG